MKTRHGIPEIEIELLDGLEYKTMLELGCKGYGTYKRYFESNGVKHTSVDLNGLGGSLKMDLMEPLNLGTFDVVTNFGTTEHVASQFPVWENIHKACGKYIASVTPAPGDWVSHGRFYPTPEWYQELCYLNGYDPIIVGYSSYGPSKGAVRMLAEKVGDKSFVMPDDALMFINKTGTKVGMYQ